MSKKQEEHTSPTILKALPLDLVFCVDNTGSMGAYIAQVQANINNIVSEIMKAENVDIRFALVSYRDFPPQDSTYSTQVHPWTTSVSTMQKYVASMAANGGGDGPECVTEGLHQVLCLEFRPPATKICILVSDAPPHGLGESGDGFPEGDPTGRDPLAIVNQFVKRGIVLYTIGCEPAISHFRYARYFMMAIASITEGKYVPLHESHLLATVIIGGAREEIHLTKVMQYIEEEAKEAGISWDTMVSQNAARELPYEFVLKVMKHLVAKGVMTTQLIVEDVMRDESALEQLNRLSRGASVMARESALAKAKDALAKFVKECEEAQKASSAEPPLHAGASSKKRRREAVQTSSNQRVFIVKDFISFDQVKRVLNRKTKMLGSHLPPNVAENELLSQQQQEQEQKEDSTCLVS